MDKAVKTARIVVDGRTLEVEDNAVLLQAMLDSGLDIPHYCYHPKLTIDGSCRLCSVKIEGMPKLQISCNTRVRDGMVVHLDDPEVAQTRRGVLELLLLNHPLDCPICDKAGECWLQNYSMRFGSRFARTLEPRRKHGKRMDIGERMLLDQERCILCRRCVRFCREISKTGELVIYNRGDHSVLDIGSRLDNAYSMCTADICPVGALETKDFHHKIRVWFLSETASVCPGCATGCNTVMSEYRNRLWRIYPRRNDAVNDTWMCDGGRFAYKIVRSPGRLTGPLIAQDGALAPATWEAAIGRAADSIRVLRDRHGDQALGALISPHLTVEENFRFGQLLCEAGVNTIAMAVRRGASDDFLIHAEKAPNAQGARSLGLVSGQDDGLANLLRAADSGQLKGLYICGDDITSVIDPEHLGRILARLDLLIVQSIERVPQFDSAAVVFPSTTWAEKQGVMVNFRGRAQRIFPALELPPGWRGDGEIFTEIRNLIFSRSDRFDQRQIWQAITATCPPFSGLSWESLGDKGLPLSQEQTGAIEIAERS
jgi:NADH-quinone oxidoreductase subunit G